MSEAECFFGSLWFFGVCVLAVLAFVPVVTVLSSNVNVVGEAVFSVSDTDSVETRTFALCRTHVFCGKPRICEC